MRLILSTQAKLILYFPFREKGMRLILSNQIKLILYFSFLMKRYEIGCGLSKLIHT